jgi:hypothetical protein
MSTYKFERKSGLVLVNVTIKGRTGIGTFTFAIDTGATLSLINPDVLEFWDTTHLPLLTKST